MTENNIVDAVVNTLKNKGFKVATEVANFYRSADIGALDNYGNVWVVECKVANIGRAIEQSKTHKLSADKVFIATFCKKMKEPTLCKIKEAGIGLLYVMSDGSLSKHIDAPGENKPWALARERLLNRIIERM